MDQIKIGKFIGDKRKNKNITQSELAEMLNITDRAVSKWERGICLPDASNMLELCKILDISINDLFSGEKVDMKDNDKKLEENLLEMAKLKERKDKDLLNLEIVIGTIVTINFLALVFIASFIEMQDFLRITIIVIGLIPFLIGCFYCLKIEQTAGLYECSKCGHKYIPTYKSVFFAKHIGRKRKMKCPKCGIKSYNKKVLK